MSIPKPGEVITDGKAINIGAPIVEARISTTQAPFEPTESQILGMIGRHLKGLVSLVDDLRGLAERREQKR